MFSSAAISSYQMFGPSTEEHTWETESRQRVAQGLREILTVLNSNRTLDEVLNYIIASACHLFDTGAGAIYRLDTKDSCLRVRSSHGLAAAVETLDLTVDNGPIGEAVLKRTPVAVADLTTVGMSVRKAAKSTYVPGTNEPLLQLRKHYRALVAVPIVIKEQVYGALALYYEEPRQSSAEEMQWASVLSDQTALAIENARLVKAIQGKAILEERQRIARDLHDSVTQALYGISLYAEAATRLLASGNINMVNEHLSMLQSTALETLQEMRMLIYELRPPVLEQEGLVAALHARLESVEGRSNLATKFIVEGVNQLPATVEQALYRIAQEALNNVLKHAHAYRTTVSLRQIGSVVILEISDDGVGFDAIAVHEKGGLGLRGMEERVSQLGGRLTLQCTQGAGTLVRVELAI